MKLLNQVKQYVLILSKAIQENLESFSLHNAYCTITNINAGIHHSSMSYCVLEIAFILV